MATLRIVTAESMEQWPQLCPSSSESAIHDYRLQSHPAASIQPAPLTPNRNSFLRSEGLKTDLTYGGPIQHPALPSPRLNPIPEGPRAGENTSSPTEHKQNSKHKANKASPAVCIYPSHWPPFRSDALGSALDLGQGSQLAPWRPAPWPAWSVSVQLEPSVLFSQDPQSWPSFLCLPHQFTRDVSGLDMEAIVEHHKVCSRTRG